MSSKKPRRTRPSLLTHTLLPFLLLLSASNHLHLAQAQTSTAPLPVSGPAFARTNTRLYIQGGLYANVNYGQFFSLDLATAWPASSPTWTQLNDGPQQNIFPAVFSADQKTMITFHSGNTFAYLYSVTSGQWTASKLTVQNSGYQGINAVTDPVNGLVYLAGGYTDPTRNSMDVYSFPNDSMVPTSMPPPTVVFPNRAYYGNVWCLKRNSILYFGGYNSSLKAVPGSNTVVEFVPNTLAWSTLATTGTAPSLRADHCMTSNDDGTLMVLYGGRPADGSPYTGEVFIFNTATQVWSQGTSGLPRIYTTCTIAGDQLLIWGGIDANNIVAPAAVMIYSLTSNSWISSYIPPASYVAARASESAASSPTAGAGSGGSTGTSSSNHAGAIAGGVVGAVAIICAGTLIFLFRRRQHRATPVKTTSDHEDTNEFKPAPEQRVEDDELQMMRTQLQNQQEQLELQRRLLQLQQQQQQLQLPLQQNQYQDAIYNYQPPIFYSTSTSAPISGAGVSSPESFNGVPLNSGLARSGYADGNSHYAEAQAYTSPVVYTPPPVVANAVTTTAAAVTKTPMPVMTPGLKHESNYWEERVPGNPHAIIET